MFDLDDVGLEALRIELILVEKVPVDQDGEFLVFVGIVEATPSLLRTIEPLQPLASTEL